MALGMASDSSMQIDVSELEIGDLVGRGITATVHKGRWKGHVVAIKQIDLGKRKTELKEQIAFTREVSVLSSVSHSNLVKFFGVSFVERPFKIITEFCAGGTCFELLHNKGDVELVWTQRFKMGVDVAFAMEYLHDFTPMVIHRDLKSLNLLLERSVKTNRDVPNVKVSDFGMSRMKETGDEWEKMTKEAGTRHWMAPEVISGIYDERADVYSYAVVLFEISAREIPFSDKDPMEVSRLVAKGVRPDLEELPEDVPDAILEMIDICWAHSPEDRPSFKWIVGALEDIRNEMPQ